MIGGDTTKDKELIAGPVLERLLEMRRDGARGYRCGLRFRQMPSIHAGFNSCPYQPIYFLDARRSHRRVQARRPLREPVRCCP